MGSFLLRTLLCPHPVPVCPLIRTHNYENWSLSSNPCCSTYHSTPILRTAASFTKTSNCKNNSSRFRHYSSRTSNINTELSSSGSRIPIINMASCPYTPKSKLQSTPESMKIIDDLLRDHPVVVFSKTTCPYCTTIKELFSELSVNIQTLELDTLNPEEATALQGSLLEKTGQRTVPNVFINGNHIGGCDDTLKAHKELGIHTLLKKGRGMASSPTRGYDYDLIVIGGGSGGLAASKEAARLGKKVAIMDFVKPSPQGSTWGLGGTCVNVGCIPKKLMHQAALLGTALKDAADFGWKVPEQKCHDWGKMVQAIGEGIKSMNWVYRVSLRDANVNYINEFAKFVDDHTIASKNKRGEVKQITAKDFIVAVGGRPRYPDIPGAKEFGITSDDLFSLKHNPGKTLIIGGSYIALECAGFLAGLGIEATVMVRSIFLRGFDQQMAEMIGGHLKEHGVKVLRGWVPTKITKIKDGAPGSYLVNAKLTEGSNVMELNVNTVIFAIGRDACTPSLNLDAAGVKVNPADGRILTNDSDQSSTENIYAIGDVADKRPELTPVAIQAGLFLARRLYGNSKILADYINIPTTVFTPLEYGSIGLSEEAAINKYGDNDIEVYHLHFQPLEFSLPKRDVNKCYAKLVCVKSKNERVVGFHYLGPNAGEITQGYGLGFRAGVTKHDFDQLIGIHPTTAEVYTLMDITKASGLSPMKKGCCG